MFLLFVLLIIYFPTNIKILNAESYSSDREAIADLINKSVYFRDHGMWDQLRTTFWQGGTISISWYDGPFDKFVDESIKMGEKGASKLLKHVIATPFIRIHGSRAISEVNVILYNRMSIRGLDFDSTHFFRFYDLIEKRNGLWRIVKRTGIYEKDRIDTVQPSFRYWFVSLFINFDEYPEPYRYLASGLERSGYKLSKNIIVNNSEGLRLLYKEGDAWLSGKISQ
jgi:hypothetical protein